MSTRILLVEDEPRLTLTVSDLLTAEGYEVEAAPDGEIGLAKALAANFPLILLDVMLPKLSGFEVCAALRAKKHPAAILMLTARTQVSDRVHGLRAGADDYLPKPFDPAELLARIEALLRRIGKTPAPQARTFRFGEFVVDFDRAALLKNEERLNVTGKEMQLLQYLIENQGRIVLREEILQNVWEYSGDVTSRTVDVHIAWLRQKLEKNPQQPDHIHTIRGKGYRFSP